MSSNEAHRDKVYCHECRDEWYRDEHGLTCPRCQSDFVEVIEANNDPHDFHEAVDDPEEDDIGHYIPFGAPGRMIPPGPQHPMPGAFSSFENIGRTTSPFSAFPPRPANMGGTGVRQSFTSPNGNMFVASFSYTSNGMNRPTGSQAEVMGDFRGLIRGMLGNLSAAQQNAQAPQSQAPGPGARQPGHPWDPQNDILSQFFGPPPGARSPGGPGGLEDPAEGHPFYNMMRMLLTGTPMMFGGHPDAAHSQEEFDRILSQLMEQSQSGGGEPPASQDEIARIPKKTVDQEWLDEQDSKDCSICMEEAKMGEEISELWCGHWYHPFCIEQWLNEHGACPLCRKKLKDGREEWEAKNKGQRQEKRRYSKPYTSSRRNSHDARAFADEGGSSGSRGTQDGSSSSGGGIRDRLSRLWSGSGR